MALNSINTNSAALQAMAALNAASREVAASEQRISTGLNVAAPKDNGAVWSIAQDMRSQASGWQSVSDSLNRGQSILDVAASGAAQIGDLLQQIQTKALSYSDASLDSTSRASLQTDMQALIQQIDRTANSADFQGVNLLNAPLGPTGIQITSADQPGSQTLTAHSPWITTSIGGWSPVGTGVTSVIYTPDLGGPSVSLPPPVFSPDPNGDVNGGEALSTPLGPGTFAFTYDASPGQWFGCDVFGPGAPPVNIMTAPNGGMTALSQWNLQSASLGLGALDWSNPQGIIAAVSNAIGLVTGASMTIGKEQSSLASTQQMAHTTQDNLQTGVGNLVDADMGLESAKLQAAQTHEQLATKALTIANATPQSLLSLFR